MAESLKDLEFAGGILHIVDHPMAPPYPLGDTGTVLGINAIAGIIQESEKGGFKIQNSSNVTVFAPQNSARQSATQAGPDYVVSGPVLYSTALTARKTVLTNGKTNLVVTTNANGSVFVNGSRIIEPDIITANGVVHLIEWSVTFYHHIQDFSRAQSLS